ncbi:phosphoribosyltransferase [Gillisia sp. M10.2A]|uniref:Phosphoribosyltransferase n=1 Tax=Gillisia lutea TaxID=2909668 RepID=A0ABS9EI56_9FLAO|nr:phosphoribosyltransferase family protein [Gillisia lutea]MCF4101131.1 phosphoribosyltransferase [Gillisia lutea]
MMFKDRIDAGLQLAQELKQFKDKDAVVLAIPRGGLPLGAIVARELNVPLDVVLTKKIGHPTNKEYAIGAVSMENRILAPSEGIPSSYIESETLRIRNLLNERYKQYYKKSKPQDLTDKLVIVVDDGIATGNTILATVALVQKKSPKAIVIATPVAPADAIQKLEDSPFVSEVICLQTPYYFRAIGQFYDDFDPVTDKEAIRILEEFSVEP